MKNGQEQKTINYSEDEPLMTVQEVARLFRKSVDNIYDRKNDYFAMKLGRSLRFPQKSVLLALIYEQNGIDVKFGQNRKAA